MPQPATTRIDRRIALAIAGLVAALLAVVFLTGSPFGGSGTTPSPTAPSASGLAAAASGATANCPAAQPTPLAAGQTRTVTIETSKGNIGIQVDAALAPIAAGNFVALASCGFYDNVVFHRVVPSFVVQGGDGQYGRADALDRTKVGQGGPGYEFPDEPVVGNYTRGVVAMANSGPNTNGSQFFICVADLSTRLTKSYTIFGRVTSGMDVVDQIVSAPRNSSDLPDNPVAMTKLTVATP